MSKLKLILKILWTVPITCFIVLAIINFGFGLSALPISSNLGNSSSINFQVKTPKNLFYIAKYQSIDKDYDQLLSKLKFEVFDLNGNKVNIDRVDHFFYGAIIGGSSMDGGSVFCLASDVKYPFSGRLQSNISDLDGVFWIKTEGSFFWAFFIFLGTIIFSLFFNSLIYLKFRKKS